MNHSGTKTLFTRLGIEKLLARLRIALTGYDTHTSFKALLKSSFCSLLRTPPKIAFVLCALALVLPAVITLLLGSFKTAEDNLLQNRQITVFLNSQVSATDTRLMASALAANKNITATTLIPVTVGANEISSIEIQPSVNLANIDLEKIVSELNSHTAVEFVAFDSLWMEQNTNAIHTTKQLALVSGSLAALMTMLLVYFISQTELHRQQAECRILNQLGASRSTLLSPVILGSLLLTIIAIFSATLLAWGAIVALPLLVDISSYREILPGSFPILKAISLVLVAIFSSFLAVGLLSRNIKFL